MKGEKSQNTGARKSLNVRPVDPDRDQVEEIESIKSDHRQRSGVEKTEMIET